MGSVVELPDDLGKSLFVVPQVGNIVGTAEGPVFFSWAYHKSLQKCLRQGTVRTSCEVTASRTQSLTLAFRPCPEKKTV